MRVDHDFPGDSPPVGYPLSVPGGANLHLKNNRGSRRTRQNRLSSRRRRLLAGRAQGRSQMQEAEVGWIAAIIVGGLAGWLAEMFMKSGTGILMNIILGIVGAALANWLLGLFGIAIGGWIGYLIAGFIGACIIIFLWRAIRGRTA